MTCLSPLDPCVVATHDLRRWHGGCHHGADGWQRLSQNYMRTTCFTHRGWGPRSRGNGQCVQGPFDWGTNELAPPEAQAAFEAWMREGGSAPGHCQEEP